MGKIRKAWLLAGPHGAGKGTVRPQLARALGAESYSTGDYLHRLRALNQLTPLQAEMLDKGEYFSDEMMAELITNFVQSADSDLVFDGYPRNLAQSLVFDRILDENGVKLVKVFYLEAAPEVLVERLLARRTCATCEYPFQPAHTACQECGSVELKTRGTDSSESIKKRAAHFDSIVGPILERYSNILVRIEADRPVEEVLSSILEKV